MFVIERVDELIDAAANRMLKTLEEPAAFVHLILLTDRLGEVLPTISSRCQLVRFDPPLIEEVAAGIEERGLAADTAAACARLALGDADRADALADEEGIALRAGAEAYARAVLAQKVAEQRPWLAVLGAVRARGEATRVALEARAADDIDLYPRKERKRVETEWTERIRRSRRRVETATLDFALQLVSLWFADLVVLGLGADDLLRNRDRLAELGADAGVPAARLREAIELVEDTRMRFQLNVSEELACEALAYRLERALAA